MTWSITTEGLHTVDEKTNNMLIIDEKIKT